MQPSGNSQPRGPARWTDDSAFAAVEAAFARYQEAWSRWLVGHHRGSADERRLADDLVRARTTLGRRLAPIDATSLSAPDQAAMANIRASLPDLDAWPEPLDGLVFDDVRAGGDGAPAAPEDAATAALRRSTFQAWGAAMADLQIDGEHLDRLTVMARLGREPDPGARRRLFLSMAPAWEVIDGRGGPTDPDGPYRRLVRSSAEQWRRSGSPIEANAAALGLDPSAVASSLRRILAAYRRVALPAGLVEPWDYRYLTGALGRRLDPAVPLARLRPVNDDHLAAIGADPRALAIHYDIEPRPGRPVIPTAFTVGLGIARRTSDGWVAARPWVFATYREGGLGNLEELLHESGHALHYAAIRARPALVSWPASMTAFVEAIADVVGWTVHEPAFLAHHLGATASVQEAVVARYAGVMLDACWALFELALHHDPDRVPNEVWAEIMERDLGVRGHPEWSWWAQRGQLLDGPGYLANYALGAMMVAATRSRIRELRGDWSTGDPGWYGFVSERLLRFGGERTPRDLLSELLGGPLTADPLLADLERVG